MSNAGINRPGPLVEYSVEDWDRMFAVNTRATWLLAKAAYPALKAARGAIVAVASMSGSNAHANLGPYGPSKAAVIMLAKVLAQELGPDGIRVRLVAKTRPLEQWKVARELRARLKVAFDQAGIEVSAQKATTSTATDDNRDQPAA